MRRNTVFAFITLTILAVLITACGQATPTQDPNAEITAIASTVQAQLTQVALLTPSATATPAATATPTEVPATATPTGPTATFTITPFPTLANVTPGADNSKFTADVTVPDGTTFTPGTVFTKTWRFTNTGSTTWTNLYKLVYIDGNVTDMNNKLEVNLPGDVKPGETVDISVTFKAPAANGSYTSWWKLYSANGMLFGEPCNVVFYVGSSAATPIPTNTPIPTASGS